MKTYLRHRICNVIDIRELIMLEFLDFEGKYKGYEEKHGFWELCYVEEGEVFLCLEGKRLFIAEKQLILIPPDKRHSYCSEKGNRNRVFVICFDTFSKMLISVSGILFSEDDVQVNCMNIIMEENANTFFVNEREQMVVLANPRFGGQQVLLMQLEYMLIHLVRRVSVGKNPQIIFLGDKDFYGELANIMLRFLKENIHRKLCLDDICGRFSYSRSFLCRVFKEQTGETFITCFNRLKMEEAKRLLLETSRSVSEISSSLGFKEVKYFDALFKKNTGHTPLVYRELITKDKMFQNYTRKKENDHEE